MLRTITLNTTDIFSFWGKIQHFIRQITYVSSQHINNSSQNPEHLKTSLSPVSLIRWFTIYILRELVLVFEGENAGAASHPKISSILCSLSLIHLSEAWLKVWGNFWLWSKSVTVCACKVSAVLVYVCLKYGKEGWNYSLDLECD